MTCDLVSSHIQQPDSNTICTPRSISSGGNCFGTGRSPSRGSHEDSLPGGRIVGRRRAGAPCVELAEVAACRK